MGKLRRESLNLTSKNIEKIEGDFYGKQKR